MSMTAAELAKLAQDALEDMKVRIWSKLKWPTDLRDCFVGRFSTSIVMCVRWLKTSSRNLKGRPSPSGYRRSGQQ